MTACMTLFKTKTAWIYLMYSIKPWHLKRSFISWRIAWQLAIVIWSHEQSMPTRASRYHERFPWHHAIPLHFMRTFLTSCNNPDSVLHEVMVSYDICQVILANMTSCDVMTLFFICWLVWQCSGTPPILTMYVYCNIYISCTVAHVELHKTTILILTWVIFIYTQLT